MRKQNVRVFISLWLLMFLFGCGPSAAVQTPTATATPNVDLPIKGYSLITRGQYVYLVYGAKLQVIDVSDPAKPKKIGETAYSRQNTRMILLGNKLYGFDTNYPYTGRHLDHAMSVIDINSPSRMRQTSTYDFPDRSMPDVIDATILGNKAYVMFVSQLGSKYPEGLMVLGDLEADHPKELVFHTDISPGQITVIAPSILYVVTSQGIDILFIKDEAQLIEYGHIACESCYLLPVDGNTLYLHHQPKYNDDQFVSVIESYDIHNPLAPVQKEKYVLTNAYGRVGKESTLYAIGKDNNLLIYTLGQKGKLTQMSSFDLPSGRVEIALAGSMAYLATSSGDMLILDVSNLSSPVQVGRYSVFGYPFIKDPAITPDPADTQPPTCKSIYNDTPMRVGPGTTFELNVPLIATDTQNAVDYMRYSADDGKHWTEWTPYQSPFKTVVSIPSTWANIGASMQYRDSAGNISQVCTWTQVTERW